MAEVKKPSDNRSASQKITDLESAVMSLFNVSDNVTKDLMTMREAVKLLDNKLNSLVKALLNGEQPTEAVLSRIMMENNVADLTQKVNRLVAANILVKEEQVGENSFVVGSELEEDGTVINPRLQFALKAMSPELQAKILGAKIGDILSVKEGSLKLKILESYLIQEPKPSAPPLQLAPEAPEAAPAASEQAPAAEAAPASEAPASAPAEQPAPEQAPAPEAPAAPAQDAEPAAANS